MISMVNTSKVRKMARNIYNLLSSKNICGMPHIFYRYNDRSRRRFVNVENYQHYSTKIINVYTSYVTEVSDA